MITGIKTVEGARVTTSRRKGRGFNVSLGFDGTAFGVPVSVGPQAEHGSEVSEEATFENSSHIVFAYQLKEIRFGKDKRMKSRDYTKGALFGTTPGD